MILRITDFIYLSRKGASMSSIIIKGNSFAILTLLVVFAFSSLAIADLYQWKDEKGNIHVVDDILLVPQQYKDKVRVLKTKPSEKTPPYQQNIQPPESQPSSEQEEMYGDHPLSWWKNEFAVKKNEISELERTIDGQKKFIEDYERGRRLYRLYTKEDIEKYETYKKNLPDNEKLLNELKANLEELRRKAQTYGVPKAVRGE